MNMELPPPEYDDNTTLPPPEQPPPTPDELRERLIGHLKAHNALHDAAVERALRTVPRHLFLPGLPLEQAYADIAVATHWEGDTAVSSASQPAIVAIMLEQLQLLPDLNVLEIGAGTGYNAALMAELVGPLGHVTTVDIDPEFVAEAREHLNAAGYLSVRAIAADGAAGWPDGAPYDRIILTVGASDITPAWFEQLAVDGILLLPLLLGGVEASVALRKRGGALLSESLALCGFMRLRGAEAVPEHSVTLSGGRRLFGEHAGAVAEPIAALLRTRPRRRLWTRPPPAAVLQNLALRGYDVLTLYTGRRSPQRVRHYSRAGFFVGPPEGPSFAIFSNTFPLVLLFGTPAADRVLDAATGQSAAPAPRPIEQWQILARPRLPAGDTPPTPGAARISRRHFAFDIWTGGEPPH